MASDPVAPRRAVMRSEYLKQTKIVRVVANAAKLTARMLVRLISVEVPIAVATEMAPGPIVRGKVKG